MKQVRTGLRMAIKYAITILASGAFSLNCFTASLDDQGANDTTLGAPSPQLYDANGLPISEGSEQIQKGSNPADLPSNFKIVLRSVTDDDHDKSKHHGKWRGDDNGKWSSQHGGEWDDDGKRYSKHDGDWQEPGANVVKLTIRKIEALESQKGWVTLYEPLVNGYVEDFLLEPQTESEIFESIVENGEYLKVKITLKEEGYAYSASDIAVAYLLIWDKKDHWHGHKKWRGKYRNEHDQDDHDKYKKEDRNKRSGEQRLKVKHFYPVSVQEGFLTTLYLEVEPEEFIEYKKKYNAYAIDPEVSYAGYEMTQIITENDKQEPAKMGDSRAIAKK